MKKYKRDLTVVSNRTVGLNLFLLTLTDELQTLPPMVAGQFAEILVPGAGVMLRRPISIHRVNREENQIEFLVQIAGRGTESLSFSKTGEKIDVLLPLGNGFSHFTEQSSHPLLVGGGVGVAPLLQLGNELSELGRKPSFLFGGRSATNLVRLEEYRKYGEVFVTTEDGSMGEKGFVTNHSVLKGESGFDKLFVCGPTPMMKAVAQWALEHRVRCEVSLEHKMACGIGACLCCVEKTTGGNVCVCKEGPVFPIEKLQWFR